MPKWLKESREMDEMARRRALMILSVLSGEVTVSDAIERAQISRCTYYRLEEKALSAMVGALMPGTEESGDGGALTQLGRIEALHAKVARLEKEKRRREHLGGLTKKIFTNGPMKTARGGQRRKVSKKPSAPSSDSASTRTKGGGDGP